jgi:hypothetical protein
LKNDYVVSAILSNSRFRLLLIAGTFAVLGACTLGISLAEGASPSAEIGLYDYDQFSRPVGVATCEDGVLTSTTAISIYLPLLYHGTLDTAGGWRELGGSASGDGISGDAYGSVASIAIASDGTLYIAWISSSEHNLLVKRWNRDDLDWEQVGTPVTDAMRGGYSLVIAPDNIPYIAFESDNVYVKRWSGDDWEQVGAESVNGGGGHAHYPSLAIASDGTLYVAWWKAKNISDSDIYVKRWNGATWEEVGVGSASGGGVSNTDHASYPAIQTSPDGTPYVAWWDDRDSEGDIFVRRWNGVVWEQVGGGSASGGGISNTGQASAPPSLAVAPDGTPYIAWKNRGTEVGYQYNQIYVRRWISGAWSEIGIGSASGGGISNNDSDSYAPKIEIAPNGTSYVTWGNETVSGWSAIYIRRWNGQSWEQVGAGSASGGGISNTPYDSSGPSLAIAPDGIPYVAWADHDINDPPHWRVYMRHWLGPR